MKQWTVVVPRPAKYNIPMLYKGRMSRNVQKTALGSSASLKNDICSKDAEERQSTQQCDYQLESFYANCDMSAVENISLSDPGLVLNHGYGVALPCNIDNDSAMRNGSKQTNPRLIHQLYSRPYLTVPFMGPNTNGGDRDVESQLRYGVRAADRKPCNSLADVSIDTGRMYLCYNPQAVEHVVENWTRGGVDSRAHAHQLNYSRRCTRQHMVPQYMSQ